jgi:hypothetical protein
MVVRQYDEDPNNFPRLVELIQEVGAVISGGAAVILQSTQLLSN